MCDPVSASIIGTGALASGVSTYNQSKAANRNAQAVQVAKEGAFRDSMDRQRGYASEAQSAFSPMVQEQGATAYADKLASGVASRQQAFSDARVPIGDYAVTDSTPSNVTRAREQAFVDSQAKTDRDNTGLARLSGYGDANLNTGLSRNQYARAFGNLSDKAQRDSALTGMDMNQAASRAFKAPNAALGIVNQAGKLAMLYGAAGHPGLQYNPAGGALAPGMYGPVQPTLQTTGGMALF